MQIAFCTQMKNRGWQLRQTIAANVAAIAGTPHILVLVDYNSTDDTREILSGYANHPNVHIVLCDDREYRIDRAKNLAHMVGASFGSYLFNLDVDNFITSDLINEIVSNHDRSIHNWSGEFRDGTYGRIGAPTRVFFDVGWYPTFAYGAGMHDFALVQHLKYTGTYVHVPYTGPTPVQNSKQDTLVNMVNTMHVDWDVVNDNNTNEWISRPIRIPDTFVELTTGTPNPIVFRREVPRVWCDKGDVRMTYTLTLDGDATDGWDLPGFIRRTNDCSVAVYPSVRRNGMVALSVHQKMNDVHNDNTMSITRSVIGMATSHVIELVWLKTGEVQLGVDGQIVFTREGLPTPTHILMQLIHRGFGSEDNTTSIKLAYTE